MTEKKQECPECEGTGKMSARNCHTCGGSGDIMVHSHEHSHGDMTHSHPHPHDHGHDPKDDVSHEHSHEMPSDHTH